MLSFVEPSVHAEPSDVTIPPAAEVGSRSVPVIVLPLADPLVASRVRRGQDHGPDPYPTSHPRHRAEHGCDTPDHAAMQQ